MPTDWRTTTDSHFELVLAGVSYGAITMLCSLSDHRLISAPSSSVIDTLKKDRTFFLAYFYFDFSDTTKRDCRALAASLVFQLATFSEACQTYLKEKRKPSGSPNYDELLVMLSELLELSGRTCVVIDALDECPERARRIELSRFLQHLCRFDDDDRRLHIFITSRAEKDIDKELSSFSPYKLSLHDARLHQEELSKYITTQLDHGGYSWSSDVKKKVHEVLSEKSRGMCVAFPESCRTCV